MLALKIADRFSPNQTITQTASCGAFKAQRQCVMLILKLPDAFLLPSQKITKSKCRSVPRRCGSAWWKSRPLIAVIPRPDSSIISLTSALSVFNRVLLIQCLSALLNYQSASQLFTSPLFTPTYYPAQCSSVSIVYSIRMIACVRIRSKNCSKIQSIVGSKRVFPQIILVCALILNPCQNLWFRFQMVRLAP